jgi:hypothetical protein
MNLKFVAIIIGLLTVAVRLPGVLVPAQYRACAVKFPRSVLWGRVLMGIVALIVWGVMYHAATDEWKWARPLIVIGVPVVYWLVINFGENFLALRAVAALMLLIAKQMVDASDVSDSPWRLVIAVFAYLWVLAAVWLTVAPHQFRDVLGFFMANDRRCRLACGGGVVVGLFLVALGLFAY